MSAADVGTASSNGAANGASSSAQETKPAAADVNGHHPDAKDATIGPSATTNAAVAAAAALFDPTRAPESGLQHVPRDARLMALILQSMGIQDVQPPALLMLLEFAHRYLYEVLQDAIVYADHAGTGRTAVGGISTISLDDIQLAIQGRVNHSFTGPPNKDMLLSLASSLNSVPLPPIIDRYGIKLPPTQHCLTNVNFSIIPNSPPRDDELLDEEEEEEEAEADADGVKRRPDAEAQDGGDEASLVNDGDEGEDDDRTQDETHLADTTMTSAPNGAAESESIAQRGTKRTLEEDDDYD